MSLLLHLRHWFTPHHTNNYRARLLQNKSLAIVIGILIGTNALISLLEATPLHILGFNSSVTIDEVVSATNNERLAAGLRPLKYSETLADAARRKAANMLAENYWAHNSPSGNNPWVWFNQAGYKYIYAGENLAKDFGSTDRMMNAWMNSPTHKANIVNDKYQEIGIAITPGNLLGSDTVLVVQLFGATSKTGGEVAPAAVSNVQVPSVAAVQGTKTTEVANLVPSPVPAQVNELKEIGAPVSANNETVPKSWFVDQFVVKKTVGITMATLFLLALVADLIIAENSRLSRRVGKNWGHIIVINIVLLLVTIAHAGSIR